MADMTAKEMAREVINDPAVQQAIRNYLLSSIDYRFAVAKHRAVSNFCDRFEREVDRILADHVDRVAGILSEAIKA